MRKGRQIDKNWDIRRYKGDGALYAYCKCGFYYSCEKIDNNNQRFHIIIDKNKLYHYCPYCGAHKKWYNEIPRKIDKFQWE